MNNLIEIMPGLNQPQAPPSISFTYDSLCHKTAMSDPDMGNWTYEYDLNGNLINQTDARGVSTRLSYDDLNRVTAIDYPSDADVSFTYDLEYNGTLSRVMKGGISSNYDYDQRYRVESETITFGDLGYTTSYEYDSMDRVTSITYPDAASVNLTYNAQTLLESVEGVIDNLDYNARNQIITKELSNGVVTNYTYDTEKLLLDRIYTQNLQDLNYDFDNVGNILEIEDNVLNSVKTYGYDDLDRLTSAGMSINSVLTYQRDFTYDQYGCIHQVDENSVTISSYSYNVTPFHAPGTYNGDSLDYDNNGNLIEDEDFIYVYNDANQLSEVRYSGNSSLVEKYWYDANGKRVKKQNADGEFTYYINKYYEIDNGNATSYFFRDDERIAKQTAGGMEWYLSDHLGSTTLLVNESGAEVERTEYFPYGQVQSGGLEKYGFTGQENDANTGLMYYGARYYSPEYRVFVQPDTMLPDPYNPQALNRYSYCLNNPVRYTDPSGHVPLDTIADALFLLYDGGKYLLDQSDENKRNLEWSAASAIVPYVPGRYTKPLLKYISPTDLTKMGKYAPDALKYLGYSDEFAYAVKRGDTIHAATNARGKTIWLAEGSVEQNWGWSHIIDSRDLGTAKNQFAEFFGSQYNDMEKCKGLIMETVEKGTYINKPGSSEAFIMKVSDDHYLKVAFNEHGSINTAIPLDGSRAEKEITKYGGKK
jgi:RHS repeat-associated protein